MTGVRVGRVKVSVYVFSAFTAGVTGVLEVGWLGGVTTNLGQSMELTVIAAAVIGGTSLFGGRGRVVSALLGALVIIGIENGMGLLNLATGTRFVITGLVLLAAVLVDALSTRRRAARGVV